jgi:hypothetical protein
LNAGEIELPDIPKLQEQLLTLVIKGARIDHQPGDHDDWANAAAGAVWAATSRSGRVVVPGSAMQWASQKYSPHTARLRMAQHATRAFFGTSNQS